MIIFRLINNTIEEDIFADVNFQLSLNINIEILERMKNADKKELKEAFENVDNKKMSYLLGYSQDEMFDIEEKLQFASAKLINDYPEIKIKLDDMKKTDCQTCNFNISEAFHILKKNNFELNKLKL